MNSFLAQLLQNTLIVAAAVPLVLLLGKWRRHRPAEQHLLWLLLTIKLVLPPLWTVAWPEFETTPTATVTEVPALEPAVVPQLREFVTEFDSSIAPQESRAPAVVHSRPLRAPSAAPAPWTRAQLLELAMILLGFVYVAGVLLFAATTLRRIYFDLRLVRQSKPAPRELADFVAGTASQLQPGRVQVRVVEGLAGPVVLWWKGSLLLWPVELIHADERQRSVGALLHELAHLRRYDHVVAWLEMFVAVVHWWNPVFWFIRRQLRETREVACDALALQSGVSRQHYAELLVDLTTGQSFFRTTPLPSVGVGAVSKSSLKRRIAMIFEPKISGRMTSGGALLAAGLVALLLVTVEQTSGQSETTEAVTEAGAEPEKASGKTELSDTPLLNPAPNFSDSQATPRPVVAGSAPSTGQAPELPRFERVQLRTAVAIETPLPPEVADQIRQAVTKAIDETIAANNPLVAEEQRQLYKERLQRWLATLPSGQSGTTILRPRVVYESYSDVPMQRTEVLQPQPALATAPPAVVPVPTITAVFDDWKYDLELAEITLEEKAYELESARHNLDVYVKAGAAVSNNELNEARRKVKLAELGVRKARIEIDRIKQRAGNR